MNAIESLYHKLAPCTLCPHRCGIDRAGGKTGRCRTGMVPAVASCNLHHGEEPPISGTRGSGTIFFANCTLSCVFCQNYPLSQLGHGKTADSEGIAAMMLALQRQGAHNINFVTPSHVAPFIADAVARARSRGMSLPIVYNTSGYDDAGALKLLEGTVDIYLPDAKYSDDALAVRYSGAEGYAGANRAALKEMYRQTGNLVTDAEGLASRGMIIRHLVLPGAVDNSKAVLQWIARELGTGMHISLMAQYHPAHEAVGMPGLDRRLTQAEYEEVCAELESLGFENGWVQEL